MKPSSASWAVGMLIKGPDASIRCFEDVVVRRRMICLCFGMQFWPRKRGYRRPILTPLMFCQTVRCEAADGVGDEAGGYDCAVRRAFYVQRWSVKKIVRELHVSRNTVRKILRSDETDFSYERTHQPMPRIGPWQEQLDRFLAANVGKPSRERLTLILIFEELRALGYEGGYDAVRRFARNWSQNRRAAAAEAYVPLSYDPGEAYQFDWSHEVVLVSGVTVTVKMAMSGSATAG